VNRASLDITKFRYRSPADGRGERRLLAARHLCLATADDLIADWTAEGFLS
jgi:hypothetical protein